MARGKNIVVDHGIDWLIDEDDNIIGYLKPNKETVYFTNARYNSTTGAFEALLNQDGTDASIGGVIKKTALTSSRATTSVDDATILSNNTANNYTVTIAANTIPNGLILQQLSTGTVTLAAGAGVTFIGSTLATSSAGQTISILPTSVANTFIVKVA